MGLALELDGHEVRVACDGPTALEIAAEFRPTIVLLDLGLPVMDGYEIASRLRSMDGTKGVRIVAVSGYGLAADLRRTAESGFEHHLVKPVDPVELAALMKEWC
jgi:CheY-like chemotaxis protein